MSSANKVGLANSVILAIIFNYKLFVCANPICPGCCQLRKLLIRQINLGQLNHSIAYTPFLHVDFLSVVSAKVLVKIEYQHKQV